MTRPADIPPRLTDEEKKAIRSLNRLAKKWPETLWIFSGGGNAVVLKNDRFGKRAHLPGDGVDPDYVVGECRLPIEGGDW